MNTLVELELAFEASIVSMRFFDIGKDQIGGEIEQSAYRQAVPQSCTMSPNDPNTTVLKNRARRRSKPTTGRISELIGDLD
uniref:Uncharacterized protein n=1 Tax=Solanum tuberosum TaxID=4113 RepID=M1DEJ4_SOLTU